MMKYGAEFLGTFWIVILATGSNTIAANLPQTGVGTIGTALVCGLAFVASASAMGRESGAHYNPAVTIGHVAAGRMPIDSALWYVVVQLLGALVACAVLTLILKGRPGFDLAIAGLSAAGYGEHSPTGYGLQSALLSELVSSAFLLSVYLASTLRQPMGAVPVLGVGSALIAIEILTIPITNGAVNPAGSTGSALLVRGWALQQLWLFWIGPVIGATITGFVFRFLPSRADEFDGARESKRKSGRK
jgi:aquaporin Z